MNRIRLVSPLQDQCTARKRFRAKWALFTLPAIRSGLAFCALWTLADFNSNAVASPSSTTAHQQTVPSARVWIEKGAHKLNVDANGVILKGYDPVAYFTRKQAVKGSPKYQTSYNGAIYYFSSAADLALFKKNPSKYAPQYGGFCANSMKDRRAVDSDPNVFFIIKGKLYVCSSPDAEKEFRSNEAANIKKADENWDQEDRWFY